jgi:ribosomal protein S18 acetylase RimI-like enzyme
MSVEIKALTPELVEDYLAFFDSVAFADNPDWSGCYCYFYLLSEDEDRQVEPGKRAASVVCFIVAPAMRRQGIARAMLERACADARSAGFDLVEAYPRKKAETSAENYHGPLSLYRAAGFAVHRELDSACIVRKELGALR